MGVIAPLSHLIHAEPTVTSMIVLIGIAVVALVLWRRHEKGKQARLEAELRYVDRLRRITREQIRDAARRYLSRTDYARLAFMPKP